MGVPVDALTDRADAAATRLLAADSVLLASHIDADGLTSAGIAARALERAEIPFEVVFSKQLDEEEIASIAEMEQETVFFTDFGSGQLDIIVEHEADGSFTPVIADHHQPAEAETTYHVNPLLEGIDGGSELSGAGTTYLVARALAEKGDDGEGTITDPDQYTHTNRDLAALAVVGAVGDMQTVEGELVGANRAIVEDGIDAGVLEVGTDLSMYGTQTRPLPKLLEYASDVRIPGITNDPSGAIRFLEGLDLELQSEGTWRTWADLGQDERRTVVSALLQRAVRQGVSATDAEQLVGTTYLLTNETPGTTLRDASEFSTLLNATARYDRADVGLAVCLGDRDQAFEEAKRLLRQHRRNLSEGLDWVRETGVTREDTIQWFHAEDRIRETIVGIVAGMALGTNGIDRSKPIVAFAHKSDAPEETKVSARGTGPLLGKGLDLSVVMREASRAVGGDGGGHAIAAGATVPRGAEPEFVRVADGLVADQLGAAATSG